MDEKELEELREKFGGKNNNEIYDPGFQHVAKGQFTGECRKWPFSKPGTFAGAPYRPGALEENFRDVEIALVGVPMDLGVTKHQHEETDQVPSLCELLYRSVLRSTGANTVFY